MTTNVKLQHIEVNDEILINSKPTGRLFTSLNLFMLSLQEQV